MTRGGYVQGGVGVSMEWVCLGDGYVRRWVALTLTAGGGHQMCGWQTGSTHPTGMLSCCSVFQIFSEETSKASDFWVS